jgi:hypothetical protein
LVDFLIDYPNLFFISIRLIILIIMSIDLTEPTTPPTQRLGKRKALRSDLFTKDLFEEKKSSARP